MFDLKTFTPYKQAVIVVGLAFIVMTIAKFCQLLDITAKNPERIWVLSATFGLFFTVANCLFSLNAKDPIKFWNQSMLAFAFTILSIGGLAWLLSGISITKMGSFSWLYIVIVIGYVVFSTIVRLMRTIVDFAMKEEWNQPKKRKQKGKRK